MRRDFAYGFLAGLVIGLLWLHYAPKPAPRGGKVLDIFAPLKDAG